MVRDLAAPAWVDSVHHATLMRLILEQGAYPDTYQPLHPCQYSQLSCRLSYGHGSLYLAFRFGAAPRHVDLRSGPECPRRCHGLPVHIQPDRERKAALFSALICGVFTPMPAYLTSWGRYTHLTGMLILPAAYALFVRRLPAHENSPIGCRRTPRKIERTRWLLLTALATAGLFLTHYQVSAFLAGLLIAQVGVTVVRSLWQKSGKKLVFSEIGWIMAGWHLLRSSFSLPWWPDTLTTLFVPRASNSPSMAPFQRFFMELPDQRLGYPDDGIGWFGFSHRSFTIALVWDHYLLVDWADVSPGQFGRIRTYPSPPSSTISPLRSLYSFLYQLSAAMPWLKGIMAADKLIPPVTIAFLPLCWGSVW